MDSSQAIRISGKEGTIEEGRRKAVISKFSNLSSLEDEGDGCLSKQY